MRSAGERGGNGAASGLSALLGTVAPAAFFASFWQRRWMAGASGFASLLQRFPSLDAVDGIAATLLHIDPERVSICLDGRAVPVTRACARRDWSVAVHSAYVAGNTTLLIGVQDVHRPTLRFCRELEDSLIREGVLLADTVRANLYLSPPNSVGLAAHYDDHDVFVIQTGGQKRWRLYEPVTPAPLDRMQQPINPKVLPQATEIDVDGGQFLYIPRGHVHSAATDRRYSLHITLSVPVATKLDLLMRVLESVDDLRAAVPPVAKDHSALADGLSRALQDLRLDATAVAGAWVSLHAEQMRRIHPIPDGMVGEIARAATVRLDTWVSHRPGAHPCVRRAEDGVSLVFTGDSLSAPISIEPVLSFIAATYHFQPRALPELSDASKVELTIELIRRGLLTTS
jgi:hypothetical protein